LGLVGGLEIVPLGRGSGDVILGLEKTTFWSCGGVLTDPFFLSPGGFGIGVDE
jgi:hypothetical protein